MNDLLAPTPPERGATGPDVQDAAGTALAAARDVTAEIFRLIQTTATNGFSLTTLARSLVPELEQVFAAREALEREAQELRARAVAAEETLREAETQLATREVGWRAERAALEAEVAREQDHARVLAEDLERRRKELDMLEGRTRRLREQMEGIAARTHADREETLRLAREMVQSAEDARLAVLDEMEALRTALIAEQGEQARASQGAAEREAELARARQLLEQLETSRAGTAAELARARAGLVHAESELLEARHAHQLANAQIERLCNAHDDLVEDRAQLTAKLHDAGEREARLRLRITGLEQRIQAVRDGTATDDTAVAPADPAPADAEASELATALARTEERARALETELAAAKAGAGAMAARLETLQDQCRDAERARASAEERVAALRSAVDALEEARRDALAAAAAASEAPAAAEPAEPAVTAESVAALEPLAAPGPLDESETDVASEPDASPAEGTIEPETVAAEIAPAVAEPQGAPATSIEPEGGEPALDIELETDAMSDFALEADPPHAEAAADEPMLDEPALTPYAAEGGRSVAVLDASDGWDRAAGVDAERVPPTEDAAERVRALDPGCLLVNLAASGVLATAAALRAGGVTTPFWACVLAGHADGGLAIGAFDVVARPVDAERVRAQLAPLVPRGASVVMVGTESATLIPLRQGLLGIGASVRTAWTLAQATELSATATPEVVIVDLAADQAGIAEFVVGLAGRERPPVLVVVAGGPASLDAFAAALGAHPVETADRAGLVRAAATPAA